MPGKSKPAISPDFESLLEHLLLLASEHPKYRGNLGRVGANEDVFMLRYFLPKETENFLREIDESKRESTRNARKANNEGVRSLESIARRIKRLLRPYRITFPDGATEGASVMAWALSDRLTSRCGKYPRSGMTADSRAFEAIHEKLRETLERVGSAKSRKRTEKQVDWQTEYRNYQNYKKPKGYKLQKPGDWTAKFESFWASRPDLQSWDLETAHQELNAARKRIRRRSR